METYKLTLVFEDGDTWVLSIQTNLVNFDDLQDFFKTKIISSVDTTELKSAYSQNENDNSSEKTLICIN